MAIGRKKKALVHIAKSDLHLDEVTYRQILKGVAGVESAAELTTEGFGKVMKRFQEMGFKGLLPSPYQPVPRGRLIPLESPQGLEPLTQNQLNFIAYLTREVKLGRRALPCLFTADHQKGRALNEERGAKDHYWPDGDPKKKRSEDLTPPGKGTAVERASSQFNSRFTIGILRNETPSFFRSVSSSVVVVPLIFLFLDSPKWILRASLAKSTPTSSKCFSTKS